MFSVFWGSDGLGLANFKTDPYSSMYAYYTSSRIIATVNELSAPHQKDIRLMPCFHFLFSKKRSLNKVSILCDAPIGILNFETLR